MKILVTGSAGHLGEALMRTLRARQIDAIGMDVLASPFTDVVGSIADRSTVARSMRGVTAVFHSATLHKLHKPGYLHAAYLVLASHVNLNKLIERKVKRVQAAAA